MPAAKPAMGFPSLTEAALHLEAQGLSAARIGNALNISAARASALIVSGRRRSQRIHLPKEIVAELQEAANLRRISVGELALRILDTVAKDNMTDAVLDDLR